MMSKETGNSVMRVLQVDSRLARHRLNRVGIEKNTIFLQPSIKNSVQIWSVNTLFPKSWDKIFVKDVDELLYSVPAFSYYNQYVYVLIVAVFKGEEFPRISIFETCWATKETNEYRLSETSGLEFEDVPLESVVMVCGKDKLFFYDRSIVMGSIPYWHINLVQNTFTVERHDIIDEDHEKCTRFPIAFAPELGVFGRWRDNHTLMVSKDGKWDLYVPSPSTTVDLSALTARGLHETYGRGGHRMGAVESPLTFYSDGPTTIAKVTRDQRHFYFEISLNHEERTFSCETRGTARYTCGLDRMFYAMVTNKNIVIIGVRAIAVANLVPQPLSEIALWKVQSTYTQTNGAGQHTGGISIERIWNLCNYVNEKSAIKSNQE